MTEKFGIGSLGLGGLPSVMQTMEMIRKAWTPVGLPASLTPTMDAGELDKRIADLKAVEQWLNVNLGLLRGTIQGLEVQRGTLAALDAFGQAFGDRGAPAEAAARALAAFATLPQAMAQAQAAAAAAVAPSFGAGSAGEDDAPSRAEHAASPWTNPGTSARAPDGADRDAGMPEAATAGTTSADAGTVGAGRSDAPAPDRGTSGATDGPPPTQDDASTAAIDFTAGLSKAAAAAVNPAAWWDLLRTQFDQVARAAGGGGTSGEAPASGKRAPRGRDGGKRAKNAGATRAAKPAPAGKSTTPRKTTAARAGTRSGRGKRGSTG